MRLKHCFDILVLSLLLISSGCIDDSPADSSTEDTDSVINETDTSVVGSADNGPVDPTPDAMSDGQIADSGQMPSDVGQIIDDMAPPIMDMAVVVPDASVMDRPFSFFVTSLEAMRRLSGSQDGYGGNFGGMEGADTICQTIAEGVGVGHKTWKAFLSATEGPGGGPVHAIERIGEGPWYDANERLVSENIQGLLQERPAGDPQTINDLPDENGVPISALGDAHDVVTASNREGRLNSENPASTCNDWTSDSGNVGGDLIMCGHSFPRMSRRPGGRNSGQQWLSDHNLRGCAPGVELRQTGGGQGENFIGASGGYGALYCFALTP
jgi:hypothetical protein